MKTARACGAICLAFVILCFCFSGVVLAQTRQQVIRPEPSTQEAAPNTSVSLDVNYSTNPASQRTRGLGLRLHFDSSQLQFDGLANVFPASLFKQVAATAETADTDDGDPDTDAVVSVVWTDLTGANWPAAFPVRLYTATFTTAAGFNDSTRVNFTASSTTAGFKLAPQSATIRFAASNEPPTLDRASVRASAGGAHTCGVSTTGNVTCWGRDDEGQATPPAGSFTQVSAGDFHTCGVRDTGEVACWGRNDGGQATPPAGAFTWVSAGGHHTCGVRDTGNVACWGRNWSGQATPAAGSFTQVSAGDYHTCGVRTTGDVACWGRDDGGQATPPTGSFTWVSAGGHHTCGLRETGEVACWGHNWSGQAAPPAGAFAQVSAGYVHTCGARDTGEVACWGDDYWGQSTAPAGAFAQVGVGWYHACGVRDTGEVTCWGYDGEGQATPPADDAPANRAPVANAGANQTVDSGATVTLSGTASDPDGRVVSYLWEQTGGRAVTLSGATRSAATFTAPDVSADETLTFRLTVTDDDGAQASGEVRVTVQSGKGGLIARIVDEINPELPGHLDLLEVTVYEANAGTVRLEFMTRGPIPDPDEGTIYSYRLYFDTDRPFFRGGFSDEELDFVWQIDMHADGDYVARGHGVVGLAENNASNRIALVADIRDVQGVSAAVIAAAVQFDNHFHEVQSNVVLPPTLMELPGNPPSSNQPPVVEEVSKGDLIARIVDEINPELPGHLDLLEVTVYEVNAGTVRLEFMTRGPIPDPGEGTVYSYRLYFDTDRPFFRGGFSDEELDFVWQIDMHADGDYVARGHGVVGLAENNASNRIALVADIRDVQGVSAAVIAAAVQFDNHSFVQGNVILPPTLMELPGNPPSSNQPPIVEEVSKGDLIARVVDGINPELPGHLDLLDLAIYESTATGVIFEITTREPHRAGQFYRLHFDTDEPYWSYWDQDNDNEFSWGIDVEADRNFIWSSGPTVPRLLALDGNRLTLLADVGEGLSASVIAGVGRIDGEWKHSDTSEPGVVDVDGDGEIRETVQSGAERTERFTSVSSGQHYTCGVRPTREVACWGDDEMGQSTPPAGAFVSVSAGNQHACGTRDTGEVVCWGYDGEGQSTPPAGTFVSISAGVSHTCGVRETGAVACWGDDEMGQSTPPAGAFVSVSAGFFHTCGIRDTGTLACWGLDDEGQSTPSAGTFASVSAGLLHTCGIRDTGTLACWGVNDEGQATPPAGTFVSVSVGLEYACGIRDTGEVACWGGNWSGVTTPPAGTFVSINAGFFHICGIRDTRTLACWGDDSYGVVTLPTETADPTKIPDLVVQSPAASADNLETGQSFTLSATVRNQGSGSSATTTLRYYRASDATASTGDTELGTDTVGVLAASDVNNESIELTAPSRAGTYYYYACVDSVSRESNTENNCSPMVRVTVQSGAARTERFTSVSSGLEYTCGLRETGEVACWGRDVPGQLTPSAGTFTRISAGVAHACGIRDTGTVACWGHDWSGETTPPAGIFTQISAGMGHTCGIRNTGAVMCWGQNDEGQSAPPTGTFIQVSTGINHTCGIRTTGDVACWGGNEVGQLTPPAGTFTQINTGGFRTCGIRTTGDVACWGYDVQATPPAGRLTQVSVGVNHHACGIRDTGVVTCWGDDEYGQATPPAGTFIQVNVGGEHTCGIRDTGAVACWGYDGEGQATPPADDEPANRAPVVNTGTDQTVDSGATVTLSGTASDLDGYIVSYDWEQTGGLAVSLSGATSDTATFTAPGVSADETLTFRLTVTDDDGTQASDEVRVMVTQTVRIEGFTSVSSGWEHTCGVRNTGAVECWGNNENGESSPPTGAFDSVSAGWKHTCGLRPTGAVECWGNNQALQSQSPPTSMTFDSVSAGAAHNCGILVTGAVRCWGSNSFGQSAPPTGMFVAISAGVRHTCGIRDTGAVECWGDDKAGQSRPPTGVFASVSAGWGHSCGIREHGTVACWGAYQPTPPAGTFTMVSAGETHTCGVRDTGAVECWSQSTGTTQLPPLGVFDSVSAGQDYTCGIRDTGAVECWTSSKYGGNRYGQATPPGPSLTGRFESVSAGRFHFCAVRATGAVECWNDEGTPPPYVFESVSAGGPGAHTCGVRATGAVECWGGNFYGQSDSPRGLFDSVSAGAWHTCGVRDTGVVECWGNNEFGESTPPAGVFDSVSAGSEYTCGVRDTGVVECWGLNAFGQSTPPAGVFDSISAGQNHACGVRDTGIVECWGSNFYSQSRPRAGVFDSVSAGAYHTCGLRDTGVVECWGLNTNGESTPPTGGIFESVSAGGYQGFSSYTCGVHDTGAVECWGNAELYLDP